MRCDPIQFEAAAFAHVRPPVDSARHSNSLPRRRHPRLRIWSRSPAEVGHNACQDAGLRGRCAIPQRDQSVSRNRQVVRLDQKRASLLFAGNLSTVLGNVAYAWKCANVPSSRCQSFIVSARQTIRTEVPRSLLPNRGSFFMQKA